ncbi:hypothetical protein SUGI_0782750 [Cryptomeria japonica]|nr:hypothetical protein SUGI_0782750 [Cryptomeria japonica]
MPLSPASRMGKITVVGAGNMGMVIAQTILKRPHRQFCPPRHSSQQVAQGNVGPATRRRLSTAHQNYSRHRLCRHNGFRSLCHN